MTNAASASWIFASTSNETNTNAKIIAMSQEKRPRHRNTQILKETQEEYNKANSKKRINEKNCQKLLEDTKEQVKVELRI